MTPDASLPQRRHFREPRVHDADEVETPLAEHQPLTEQEKADLTERWKQRMAEPGYRESLVDPPADEHWGQGPILFPPAGVQRPEPLTEEEKPPPTIYDVAGMLCEIVASQRAALHASRAEVERLRAQVIELRSWMGRDARNAYDAERPPTLT